VPEVPDPPRLEHVCKRLRDRAFPIRWFTARFHENAADPPEQPAVAPEEFEERALARLRAYDDEALRGWLATGRGPVREAGEALARQRPAPRTLTGILAALLQRPRLAGAETDVTRRVGALTLPPRRLAPEELPVGGYSDMVTHGEPEHLLPSQHALDDMEFLRRYTENELLFFRREEPPAQNRQELVVLLDQGVRTWGDVRLVLTAAALALGKQAVARKLPLLLAGTSNAGRLLRPEEDFGPVGQLLDASDLSLTPGLALEHVLEQSGEALRDIVLLTHPRNLKEADVLAAARRLGRRDRLFALTLDGRGDAALTEVRHGAPDKVRQFRVEFRPAPVVAPKPPTVAPPATPWTGDVEPIPYPFRMGTDGGIARFEFDHDGRHLLTVSSQGMLHLWDVDGQHFDVLPRPLNAANGAVLRSFEGAVGVANGFVLAGAFGRTLFAAHYDLRERRCRLYTVPDFEPIDFLHYVRSHHAAGFETRRGLVALDLATGEWATEKRRATSQNANETLRMLERCLLKSRRGIQWPAHRRGEDPRNHIGLACDLDARTGEVQLWGLGYDWGKFTPLADGRPLLQKTSLDRAHVEADVLGLQLAGPRGHTLLLLRGPAGTVIREYGPWKASRPRDFRLSSDGKWLALLRADQRVEVENIDEPDRRFVTRAGSFTGEGRLFLGDRCFLLCLGSTQKHWHLVRWYGGTLEFHYELRPHGTGGLDLFNSASFQDVFRRSLIARALPGGVPQWLRTPDPKRYVAYQTGGLEFGLDRFGQVAVLDARRQVVAMFMAFRDQIAAWLADGTRLGAAGLTTGPDTPGARERIAAALIRAEGTDGKAT
jgi:hypothetical protein